jgi:hypothetical protein
LKLQELTENVNTYNVTVEFGPTGNDHVRYNIKAKSKEDAKEKAIRKAKKNGIRSPYVSMQAMSLKEDNQMDKGDWIISKFEAGHLTYDQAKKELKANDLDVYIHELNMADELLSGKSRLN